MSRPNCGWEATHTEKAVWTETDAFCPVCGRRMMVEMMEIVQNLLMALVLSTLVLACIKAMREEDKEKDEVKEE